MAALIARCALRAAMMPARGLPVLRKDGSGSTQTRATLKIFECALVVGRAEWAADGRTDSAAARRGFSARLLGAASRRGCGAPPRACLQRGAAAADDIGTRTWQLTAGAARARGARGAVRLTRSMDSGRD
jgi:hypothetical protein